LDLVVREARLLGHDGLFQIAVNNGTISRISRVIDEKGGKEINAKSGLVLPTFVEPHIHLDKVLLAERVQEASTIREARELVKEAKKSFTVADVTERAERVIPWALQSGVTAIRTHVDVDGTAKLASIEALLGLKKKYENLLQLQVVAFPQEGLVRESSALELVRKALEIGADVVGGLPDAEATPEESRKHIDLAIELAEEKKYPIDVHCDVLPDARTIEYYAARMVKSSLRGRATADHIIALSYYGDEEARRTISLIKDSSMNVVANPCTMMTSGGSDPPPKGRGVTRIKELLNGGVNLAFGIDNIVDPYNPFGDFDPLSSGWLLAYQGQLSSIAEFELILRMPTFNSAKILELEDYGLETGMRADLNILNASSAREALRTHTKPRYVVKNGRLIAENNIEAVRYF